MPAAGFSPGIGTLAATRRLAQTRPPLVHFADHGFTTKACSGRRKSPKTRARWARGSAPPTHRGGVHAGMSSPPALAEPSSGSLGTWAASPFANKHSAQVALDCER